MTPDRPVSMYRSGLFVHWRTWLRGRSCYGPAWSGTTWTKRGARRQAAKAGRP